MVTTAKKADPLQRFGCEELRLIVRNMDATRESFNQKYTAEQLVKIGRAMLASGWDILPDQWTERQVRAALRGLPPKWNDTGEPIHYDLTPTRG